MTQANHPEHAPPVPRIPLEPDGDEAQAAFDAKAQQWDVYSRAPLGRLRRELTLHYLGRHLDGRAAPLTVLDAGAGTGNYAFPLAQQGHHVCLLDFSAHMLDVARQNAAESSVSAAGATAASATATSATATSATATSATATSATATSATATSATALDSALLERLDFCQATVQEAPALFGPGHFDLILCHTLLEYVSDPREILQALVTTLKPGGLLSLLAVNPHADALRWALSKGDLDEARQALGQTRSSTTLFGVNRRVYAGPTLQALLAELRMETMATYGVRIFADYIDADKLADAVFVDQLWALERDAGLLAPYAQIARYNLLIGKKTGAT